MYLVQQQISLQQQNTAALQIFLHSRNYEMLQTNYYSTKSYSTKTTFSAVYYRHLRLHHRLTNSEEDRIANYFLDTLDISWTRTSLLVCCYKVIYWYQSIYILQLTVALLPIISLYLYFFYFSHCRILSQFAFWQAVEINEYTTILLLLHTRGPTVAKYGTPNS